MRQARVYHSEQQGCAVIEVPAAMFAGHKMTEVADYMDSILQSEAKNLEIFGASRWEDMFGEDGSEWIWDIETTYLRNSDYEQHYKTLLQSLPRRAQEHFGCAEL